MIKKNNFPLIMGIVNITPDSFSDGSIDRISNNYIEECCSNAEKLINEGADIIDFGGESTNPKSTLVPADEEIRRVVPVVERFRSKFPTFPISIDSRKYEVCKELIKYNIQYINDISGLTYNPKMVELAVDSDIKLIIMHYREHHDTHYANVVNDVYDFLYKQIKYAESFNVKNIIIDLGIGFGKECSDNLTLLKNIQNFDSLGYPMLLGISRKRFIGEVIQEPNPTERDFATMIYHALLLKENNIKIIRVHNVKLAKQLKNIYNSLI